MNRYKNIHRLGIRSNLQIFRKIYIILYCEKLLKKIDTPLSKQEL